MVTYPIVVKRSGYRGSDKRMRQKAAEHNRIASELEAYINGQLRIQTAPIQTYNYYEITEATCYSAETVNRLCFSIDCGHNGFTAYKYGMTREQAIEANHQAE